MINKGLGAGWPMKGQRAAVLWTQLQARLGTPGSPHPGPLFTHHGPVLVVLGFQWGH